MNGLPRLLAPAPRWLTPARIALAAVAISTAALTPAVVDTLGELRQLLRPGLAAPAVLVAITVTLALLVGRRALAARSSMGCRVWLVAGGAAAGGIAMLAGYHALLALGLCLRIPGSDALVGSLVLSAVLGGLLGVLFGVLYGPAVVTALGTRLDPSEDAVDRALAGAGGTLFLGAVTGLPFSGAGLAPAVVLATAAAIALAVAGVRLWVRVRWLQRVRAGQVPGVTIELRTGRAEEAALLPLLRLDALFPGVLVTGEESPTYREVRGVRRVALVPLPDQPIGSPIAGLASDAANEIGAALLALPVGVVALTVGAFISAIVVTGILSAVS
jgi:hypothetical protein